MYFRVQIQILHAKICIYPPGNVWRWKSKAKNIKNTPPSLKVDPLKFLFPSKFDSIACKEVREHDRKVREDEKRLHAKFWYQTVDTKMSYEVLK